MNQTELISMIYSDISKLYQLSLSAEKGFKSESARTYCAGQTSAYKMCLQLLSTYFKEED